MIKPSHWLGFIMHHYSFFFFFFFLFFFKHESAQWSQRILRYNVHYGEVRHLNPAAMM